jgi:hypothetical protein
MTRFEGSSMLQLVARNDAPVHRLALARRHIETAIAHINDEAQSRVPSVMTVESSALDELRLIVRALADIRDALRSNTGIEPVQPGALDPSRTHGSR